LNVDDKTLDELLTLLEQKKLAKLYRGKKGIELVKALMRTEKTNSSEYYQVVPIMG